MVRFSRHARDRMAARDITESDVEAALARQLRQEPGESGSIWVFGHGADGSVVKVCVSSDDRQWVITVARPD